MYIVCVLRARAATDLARSCRAPTGADQSSGDTRGALPSKRGVYLKGQYTLIYSKNINELEKHARIWNKSRNLQKNIKFETNSVIWKNSFKKMNEFEKKSRIAIQRQNLRKIKEFEKIEELEQN